MSLKMEIFLVPELQKYWKQKKIKYFTSGKNKESKYFFSQKKFTLLSLNYLNCHFLLK